MSRSSDSEDRKTSSRTSSRDDKDTSSRRHRDYDDDDDDDDSRRSYNSKDRKRKRDRKRSKERKRSGSKKKKKSSSRRYDDSDTDYSSDSSREERRRKKRKKRRHRDDYSYSSSSDSEDSRRRRKRKERKHKKSKKRSSKKKEDVDDGIPRFGKYGILRASDYHKTETQRSFTVWLEEVKGVMSFSGPKWELQEYFKDYMEDFNTATLPHIKYYNYDKYEMEEYEKSKSKLAASTSSIVQKDEALHRQHLQQQAKAKREEELKMIKSMMNRDKVEEMKRKAQLQSEMAHAFKTGDKETYARLKNRLEPER